MLSNITVDWIRERDVPKIQKLEEKLPNGLSMKVLSKRLRSSYVGLLVRGYDDQTIGYVLLDLRQGSSIKVKRIVVDEKWRRQGVGKILLDNVLKSNCKYSMNVPEENLDIQLFLKSFGFKCTAIQGESYIMEKNHD